MWFAHSNNVYSFNLNTKKLTKYNLINNVLVFFEDSKHRLWAGTDGDGIYLLDEAKKQLVPNTELDKHLPSIFIIDFKES
jgi:hypothetical protein